jgi:drug/metabolite transporter (DMT)-like permease
MVIAFVKLGLVESHAVFTCYPLLIAALSGPILGEKVGWRRWTAIGVGFLGVLIVLQPWNDGFQAAGILTVLCVIVLASRDLATRAMPEDIGTFQLVTWAYIALIPAGLILMALGGDGPGAIDPTRSFDLVMALISGLFGYYAVTAATRMGEAAVIAPFRYTRLVFALILAMLVLGERPGPAMLIGAALIIGSGLYTFTRERMRARTAQH